MRDLTLCSVLLGAAPSTRFISFTFTPRRLLCHADLELLHPAPFAPRNLSIFSSLTFTFHQLEMRELP
ncbi:hypothetical protein CYMTET_13828 [Cymbomonas tetramitiformis]|uniref:Uncharacterized protein n=1 Tax=Cymbomonas tetramitiformis TaxID=36881 RepID=A0AAE0GHP8_9CHLO|nr:hypothetical protein CYMTET_13828 [Cymbomonas tetramitiformis]